MSNSSSQLSKELVFSLLESENEFCVDFDDAWIWIGYSTKQKAKLKLESNFIENMDYILLNQTVKQTGSGGHNRESIFLTTDSFKQLAMMAGTAKGREVRQYFLNCEKELKQSKQTQQYQLPKDYLETLKALVQAEEEKQRVIQAAQVQKELLDAAKPKVEFYDAVADSEQVIDMEKVAKILNFKNIGRNNLFKFLRNKQIFTDKNIPYQKYCDYGYFRCIESRYVKNGEVKIYVKTVAFQKGLDFIRKLLNEEFDNSLMEDCPF